VKIDGFTISELAERLELPYRTVQKRLKRAGIEPITTGAIYPKNALETLRKTSALAALLKSPPPKPPRNPGNLRSSNIVIFWYYIGTIVKKFLKILFFFLELPKIIYYGRKFRF